MKKLLLVLMALILSTALIACTNNDANGDQNPGTEASQLDGALNEILGKVIDGITPEELALDMVEVTADFFPGIFFVDAPETYEAYVSMPFIGSIAHQIAILRVPEGTDVAALAASIEANADPRKWMCVEAEKTAVVTKDNVILFAMSTADVVDAAVANFNAL